VTAELANEAYSLIRNIRTLTADANARLTFDVLLRRHNDTTSELATRFEQQAQTEHKHDPAQDWIANSPNAASFQMGNLIPQLDRPDIPKLRADTVFLDKKAYMIPHIYGSLIEDEYQKIVLDELKAERFDMKLIESPMASNPEDNPQGDYYLSRARAYFAFINFSDKELVRPEVGARVKIIFQDDEANTNNPAQPDTDDGTDGTDNGTDSVDGGMELGADSGEGNYN
jgi:hypothetical protein